MSVGAVSSMGALLPREVLEQIVGGGNSTLVGVGPADYGLDANERLGDAVNRSWLRLTEMWAAFRRAEAAVPNEGEAATGLTRERWLVPLLAELGFGNLKAVQSLSPSADGKSWAISHEWERQVPVHLLGWRTPIDRRTPGLRGAAAAPPHGLVQDFLNCSESHLWGIVSNGKVLRLLRDNKTLTRPAYVEFDLVSIFDGESFAEFTLLWLCCHRTRFEGDPPDRCFLEKWHGDANKAGTRARDKLRDGVEKAILCLGDSVLSHPANGMLRDRLRTGELKPDDLQHQLLRVVYRMLFLLVAESRGLLLASDASPGASERYRAYYSMERLCRLARDRTGGTHGDLWQGLLVTMAALDVGDDPAQRRARAELGLTSLGSALWSQEEIADVGSARVDNSNMLEAVRSLAFVRDDDAKALRPVDYENLGTEELGSIYESLLELNAEAEPDNRRFILKMAAGSERKTTGSYYTPPDLISRILDDALDPAIERAKAQTDPERALLDLKVLDPACGSGHFLIAASHRVAHALATVRDRGAEPSPEASRAALREVVGRCLYGIDLNPMAVELCKVSLWLESNTPGRPLGFLDHRIVCGNSLLGTTPRLLTNGIPDAAFKPVTGDDKKKARALRARNKTERKQPAQAILTPSWSPSAGTTHVAEGVRRIDSAPDDTAQQVAAKEAEHDRLWTEGQAVKEKLLADAWCAAFVVPKTGDSPAITDAVLKTLKLESPERLQNLVTTAQGSTTTSGDEFLHLSEIAATILRLADEYRFTHLHLVFPDVFDIPEDPAHAENEDTGWSGGFDAVLGNPPFLNQLRDLTVTQGYVSNLQATRYGTLASAYTDAAYVFLALSCEAARPDRGRVGLVQPESLLAADGAAALRRQISCRSTIESLWVAGEKVFSANVLTCAVVVRSGQNNQLNSIRRSRGSTFESLPELEMVMSEVAEIGTWGPLIADTFGVPLVQLKSSARLGDVLSASADFRDQYYGLEPFVTEAEEWSGDGAISRGETRFAPLITVGLIDPLHSLWGKTPTRFAKRRWRAPVVNVDRLRSESDLGEWADRRLVPKLLVATQTPVLEVIVDEEGRLLPSVPVITVVPAAISLWHAAALLNSPALTAYAAARHLGASLSTTAMKLSARQIEDLPLPRHSRAWDAAAEHAHDAFRSTSGAERSSHLRQLAHEMCLAYGIEDSVELIAWWMDRLPERQDSHLSEFVDVVGLPPERGTLAEYPSHKERS